eukprot:INCI18417.2.p1 GENE.INCI18417.2~~INCI18417.2.p1  ORF type:complete len:634 (-),score=110.27 INCI18417.2:394-2295(-)
MPSKKMQLGKARRNRILLYFGIAGILLLTAVYQVTVLSRALTNQHPKFVDQFQEELDKALAMQQTVRRHIDDLSAARAAGALTAESHAQQLAESNGQIADLSQSIHDLQAKYVRLASSSSQAAAAAEGGPSASVQEAAQDLVRHAREELSEGTKAVEQSLRQALEQAAAASSVDKRFAAAAAGAAWGSAAASLRGSAAASSNGPFLPPGGAKNDPSHNHGPGGKGHLIPHATGAVDPGAAARAAANADPATRAKQENRAGQIRDAIAFVWKNYRQHAWGQDNLNPISGRGASAGFNHAVTLLDSLDTLWLAGLRKEFDEAVEYASKTLASKLRNVAGGTSAFETTIRSLGGLEGAYALSKDERLVPLIEALGKRIDSHVGANGITPYRMSGGKGGMGCNTLAESGTNQLELNFLAQITNNPSYGQKSATFYPYMDSRPSLDGLYPNCFERGKGKITFGADGDSFYEYLVKVWLQTGRTDERLWRMYNAAIDGMDKWLVQKGDDGLTYLMNLNWVGSSKGADHAMEHLSCFVPAWLMLGQEFQTDPARKAHIRELAEQIAYTCWQMYEQQPTGIAPERVKSMKMDLSKTDTREYILRPEALEGFWFVPSTAIVCRSSLCAYSESTETYTCTLHV